MGKVIGLIPQPQQTKEQDKKPAPKPVKKPAPKPVKKPATTK